MITLKYVTLESILISLLKFYDIVGWESWGYEDQLVRDSVSEPDDIEGRNATLATAVANHPNRALRALAQRLGVKWEKDQERKMEEMAVKKQKAKIKWEAPVF